MLKFAVLVALLPFVAAQAPIYGQCGGNGWSGATTCVSGSVCTKLNDWYSQCLPGSGAPSSTAAPVPSSTSPGSSAPAPTSTTIIAGNPYQGYDIYLSPYYAAEVQAAADAITNPTLKAKALKIASVPTFIWFDVVAKVPDLRTYLAEAGAANQLLQIVVYDLPDRDCAALASNGEFHINDGGEQKYYNYIDQIVAAIADYPDVRVVAVVEPDSLANLVTNLNVAKCANAREVYLRATAYAMSKLNSVGVYQYLDAGHAGWLGWPANLQPAADLFNRLFVDAGRPEFVRGLATNVANFNALSASSPDPATQGNPNYDELRYINGFAPLLNPFPNHFIVDQGRSGVQNIRNEWGNWCNVDGAGFGIRPTTNTGSQNIDAIVWIKPGGESDGTSDSSSPRYDSHCSNSDAKVPAPEAGTWFQAYFEMLVTNANPAL